MISEGIGKIKNSMYRVNMEKFYAGRDQVTNRIFLVNTETGKRILMAKFCQPKWESSQDLDGELNNEFSDNVAHYGEEAALGKTIWKIEYEIDASAERLSKR